MALSHDLYGACFAADTVADCAAALADWSGDIAAAARKALARNAPLAMACTLRMIRQARAQDDIRQALAQEYRYTWRAAAGPDFVEGIRAQIIDKDRNPRWQHAAGVVAEAEVAAMLAPLGAAELAL